MCHGQCKWVVLHSEIEEDLDGFAPIVPAQLLQMEHENNIYDGDEQHNSILHSCRDVAAISGQWDFYICHISID